MLSRAIRASLRHPRLIAIACLLVIALGVTLAPRARLDALPTVAPAQTSIETEAPGMVAEQVEQLVTRPIENALIGARGVAAVRSRSIQGLSVVTIDIAPGADPDRVRQALSEGLGAAAGTLPAGVGAPKLAPLVSGGADSLTIGFTSDRLTPMALRDLVQWTVRPRLLSIPGIARAQIFGGEVRRVEVRARAGDLSDSDLGYADVFDAVRRATSVTGAGFIDTPNQRIPVEPEGQALTDDDVAAGQIQVVGSAPVRISDVADVVDAPAPEFGDALIEGRPGVILGLASQYGVNTLETTRAIDRELATLGPALARQGVVLHAHIDRPAGFVTASVYAILWDVVIGIALVTILLVLLFRDPRAALVSMASIPLAILAALGVVTLMGWTLNAMTLGGLAVALGLIVDDAVIDVESILRRLRDADARHASRAHAILMASLEVRGPVIYATVLVVVALAPIFLMSGAPGDLLGPMVVSIVAASLGSLVVAILVTPALALLFLGHVRPAATPPLGHRLAAAYDRVLGRLESVPALVGGGAAVMVLTAAFALPFFRFEFLPTFHDDHLIARIEAPAATSISVMREYGASIAHDLMSNHEVVGVAQEIGRAEGGDAAWGPGHARFDIALRSGLSIAAEDAAANKVRALLSGYPGWVATVQSGRLIGPADGAQPAGLRVRVFGGDLDAMERVTDRVATLISTVPGVRRVAPTAPSVSSVVRVDLNFQRLAIYGLSAADVLDTVQTAFEGRRAAEVYEDGRAVDIAVTAQAGLRQDPEGVGDLLLRSSSGVSAPLKSVANIYLTDGRTQIEHEGGLRSQSIPFEGAGDVRTLQNAVQKKIDRDVVLPAGTFAEVIAPDGGGEFENGLLFDAALAVLGIFAVLLLALGDMRSSAIVVGSTLFALVGGALMVAVTGGVLTLGAVMGFVALFGLSARNAILLLARLEDLASEAPRPIGAELVRTAACERASAIVISALLIAAALMPMAIRSDLPGHEILGPMALVILGGLVSATLLSLFVSPIIVSRFWRPRTTTETSGDVPASV